MYKPSKLVHQCVKMMLDHQLTHSPPKNTIPYSTKVSALPELKYPGYRRPHYQNSEQTLSLARPKTEDTPTISSLEVKKRETKLVCAQEELINVRFTFVGEAPGPVDIMYLVRRMSQKKPWSFGYIFCLTVEILLTREQDYF